MRSTIHSVVGLFLSLTINTGLLADELVLPERALSWTPKDYPEATLYARIPFLEPPRPWERLDVWVPKTPEQGRLPCVVAVFGGGYGDKMGGFINDARPLLSRGFVVAAPDYALQTDAPVPLCAWDLANAIRYLRAHAEKYRIDPERIGVWGWSAGGWIAQDLCYAGPERMVHAPSEVDRQKVSRWFPMLQPGPLYADQSVRVQAVVTDWGAEKLWEKRNQTPQPWLSPDDPPLFTCYNGEFAENLVNPVMLLRKLGVPSRGVYGIRGNTHVPNLGTEAAREDGSKTTWGDAIYEFLEQTLRANDTATAPEMIPHGGAIDGTTAVRLLTVHPTGSMHYTLDGAVPDQSSPRYEQPIRVAPGQTLRAIVYRPGLKPSRVTTGRFIAGPKSPTIVTPRVVYEVRIGQPFRATFNAENADTATWYIGGRTGEHYRQYDGQCFNPPRHIPWLTIDARTGILSGVPRTAGVYPVIVSCMAKPAGNDKVPPSGDAVLIIVTVRE